MVYGELGREPLSDIVKSKMVNFLGTHFNCGGLSYIWNKKEVNANFLKLKLKITLRDQFI